MKNEFHGRRNRWEGFKGRTLITLVLVCSMIISVPFFSNAANEKLDKSKLTEGCSLTVTVNDDEFVDLKDVDLVVDLYQIASAKANDGSDGYTFQWNTSYASVQSMYENLENGEVGFTADNLHKLSQAAAGIVLNTTSGKANDGISPAPKTGNKDENGNVVMPSLDGGLYLLVVRGNGTDRYVTTRTGKDEAGENEIKNIVTFVSSEKNSYTFLPQLVSLPTRSVDGVVASNRAANTSDNTPWQYGLTVYLKPELNNGSLKIVKTLDSYYVNGGEATFVFEVTAWLPGIENPIYNKIFSLIFDNAGSQSIYIDSIPAGAKVTIREIYDGWSYTVDGASEQTIDILGSLNTEEVNFTNKYDDTETGGHGIINRFTYEDGKWGYTQIEDSTVNNSQE